MSQRRMRGITVLSIALVLVAGTASASRNHYGKFIRATSPIAYWRLGQGSGTAAYPRAGKYVGKYRGAPKLGRPGLIRHNHNKAVRFDGKDDRVTIDKLTHRSKASWANGYTLEAWVRTSSTATEEHIVSFNKSNGGTNIALFRDEPSNKFKFHDCEGPKCVAVFSRTTPVVGKTYQVVVTVNAANHGRLYVNGKAQASFRSAQRPVHFAHFTIGADYDWGNKVTSYWHGKIDEVAIYNRGLSPARVAAQWAKGK